MSLYSALNASVTGMSAQANWLSAISENISNSSTVGYKQGDTSFQDLIDQNTSGDYNAIGVTSSIRYNVTGQGSLTATTSATDLAIQGNGFFVVKGSDGSTYMTRAGSFTPDSSGNLVNTAGYTLQGYSLSGAASATGLMSGLSNVNVNSVGLSAAASKIGTLTANLPSTATVVASPSATNYTDMTSITAYSSLGAAETLDVKFSKTGDSTWQADVYNEADPTTNLASSTLTFDPNTGALVSGSPLVTPISSGGSSISLDVTKMTQLASAFGVTTSTLDGNSPSAVKNVTIGSDGTLSFIYANGIDVPGYKIPLASVESPDRLTNISGDVFQANTSSGNMIIDTAGTSGLGTIQSDNLEGSTVDLAGQLTQMIEAQRGYEANSKVFQAGSDLLSTLINTLK